MADYCSSIPQTPFDSTYPPIKPVWTLPDVKFKRLYVWGTHYSWKGQYIWIWVYSKNGKFVCGGDADMQIHFQYYIDTDMQVA